MNMHTPGSPLTVILLTGISYKYRPMNKYIIYDYERPPLLILFVFFLQEFNSYNIQTLAWP